MTTGLYASQHASALRQTTAKGAAVSFTSITADYDPATDRASAMTVATITGSAVRVGGNPQTYARLSLIQSEAPTLFFTPSLYGQLPPLGSTVIWGGVAYVVKDVDPVAPDGVAIAARIVITSGGVSRVVRGTASFTVPVLSFAALGQIDFRYVPGNDLSLATFSRASVASFLAGP